MCLNKGVEEPERFHELFPAAGTFDQGAAETDYVQEERLALIIKFADAEVQVVQNGLVDAAVFPMLLPASPTSVRAITAGNENSTMILRSAPPLKFTGIADDGIKAAGREGGVKKT